MSSIGLLAAGVAHEVNTPLAVISSYAQMLAKQVNGDTKKSELLDKITRQTFRASEIVNSLLNFSRTSSTEFTSVDVNRVIQDTLMLLEHQLKVARVKVVQELQLAVAADLRQHRQAAAGLPEPVPQCERCHAFRRHADGRHPERAQRAGHRCRHRQRHRAGTHPSHLRSVLHHQEQAQDRAQRRNRAGTFRDLRHYPGARRQDSREQQARRGHNLHHGISPD